MAPAAALLLLLSLSLLPAVPLSADTIVLKNGRHIVAGTVTEEGEKVFYEGPNGRISIPKSLVERIEKGGEAPPSLASSPARPPLDEQAARELAGRVRTPQNDSESIIRNGAVDEERLQILAGLAGKGEFERQNAVNAHLIAASFEASQQRFGPASRWAEEALRLNGRDLNALLLAAEVDLVRQRYSEALEHLFAAQSVAGDTAPVLTLFGYAYYFSDGPEKALRYWKQAQSIQPDARLADRIRKTESEAQVEGGFAQAGSGNFQLSWEGSEVSPAFSREILETLERLHRELEAELYFSPRDPIVVVLYGTQQFADITQMPRWVGALNDGRIRVPVRGLTGMTPELARALKHEMVHSFVYRLAEGRCPTWLNEGLAQLLSGESAAAFGARLAQLYGESRQIPLSQLEGSFMQFDTSRAGVAYAESLAAAEMIRERYGAYQLPELVKALGQGKTMGQALRKVLRSSYEDVETELAQYLVTRYGR